MKVECVKNNLKDALLIAERFTGKQLSLPVLRYVLFLVDERSLKLRATNLDIGIEIEIPARVEREGVIAIPADTLGSFLSNLVSEKNITIEQVNANLVITGQSHSTVIKGYPYEDFPTLPFVTKGTTISIGIEKLLSAFRATQYAVATTDIKPEFASIYCYTDEQSLCFVASNSSRLAEKKIPLRDLPEQFSLLIPGKNVAEIMRALEHETGDVTMCATKNQLSFHTERVHITSRLVDGNFPDYRQLIAKQFLTEATIAKQDMTDKLKLTTIFSGKLQQVRLKIYPTDKLFEIESKSDELGETTQNIDAEMSGEDMEMLLNQRFLGDVFPHITADKVSFFANGPHRPLVIRGVGDHTYTYLIMPMKG